MGRTVKCYKMSSGSERDSSGEEKEYNEEDFDVEDEGAALAERLGSAGIEDPNEDEYEPYSGEPLADAEWTANYNQRTTRAKEQLTLLHSRLDGSVPVSSW